MFVTDIFSIGCVNGMYFIFDCNFVTIKVLGLVLLELGLGL